MQILSEKTKVALGTAILAIGGAGMWVGWIQFQTAANAQGVERVSKAQAEYLGHVADIDKRLSVIEAEIRRIRR